MTVNRATLCLLLLLAISVTSAARKAETGLSAAAIIQRAIDSSGGEARLRALHSMELIENSVIARNAVLSTAIKRSGFNKYFVSSLGAGHVSTTTIYNNGVAATISGNDVTPITDPDVLEGLQLRCYASRELGYRELGYTFTKEADVKFRFFDCYTISVRSPRGYRTENYYDKQSGRCIMIIYENGRKTLLTDVYRSSGLIIPAMLLEIDENEHVVQSGLQKVAFQQDIDSNWFVVPKNGEHIAPDRFRTGRFRYLNSNSGSEIVRDATTHTEQSGDTLLDFSIGWKDAGNYTLTRSAAAGKPENAQNPYQIHVRIISWNENSMYVQYLDSKNIGGTCAFRQISGLK